MLLSNLSFHALKKIYSWENEYKNIKQKLIETVADQTETKEKKANIQLKRREGK